MEIDSKEILELKEIMDNELRKYLKESDLSAIDLLLVILQGYMCLIREIGWDECFSIAEEALVSRRGGSFAIATSMSISADIYNRVNEELEKNPIYQKISEEAFNEFGGEE